MSVLMPVYAFLSACVLPGLTIAVSAMGARAWTLGREGDLKAMVKSARRLFFIGYGILFFVVFPSAGWIAEHILGDVALKKALRLLLFCFLFAGAESTGKAALMAAKQIEKPFLSELTEQSVRFVSVYLFLQRAKGGVGTVEAIIYGMAVSELFGGLALHLLYKKAFSEETKKTKHIYAKEILKTAIPVNASGIASSALNTMISAWLPVGLTLFGLDRKTALCEIGALSMASSVTMFPTVLVGAVGNILMQRLNGAAARKDRKDIRRKLSRAWCATACIAVLSLAFFLLFGEKVCFWIYKNKSAQEMVPSLACLAALSYFSMILHSAQNGLGLQVKSALSNFTAMLICLGADLWLVPHIGIKGYIVGMFLSEIYDLTESVIRVRSCTGWQMFPFLSAMSEKGNTGKNSIVEMNEKFHRTA